MPRSVKFTNAEIIAALEATHGLVYLAAKRLGCSDVTIFNRIKRYKEVAAARERARAEMLDLAESRLFEAIDRGEQWAINSILRTLGRDRGYTERVEHTGGGEPIRVEIIRRVLTDHADHDP